MNDYTNLLYHLIGPRIKKYRKKANLNQVGIRIERATLSNIENGKTGARNPHYMNGVHISDIVDSLHEHLIYVSPSELVWGDRNEKLAYLKMIVLALLFNGSGKNPFQLAPAQFSDETMTQVPALKETVDFFTSSSNHELFELLKIDFDKSYTQISNLILKQLLMYEGLFPYFDDFLKTHSAYDPKAYKELVNNYLLDKGDFSDFISDENSYPQFIIAFCQYWERVQNEYLSFFTSLPFCSDDELKQYGMKIVSNKAIHDALISDKFIEINKQFLLMAEYADINIATAFMLQRISMVAMINRDDPDMFCDDTEIIEESAPDP